MKNVFYHDIFAWNLIHDAAQIGMIDLPSHSYPTRMIAQAIEAGWINAPNLQLAREMFVLADQILLPGGIDVPSNGSLWREKHINWWHDSTEDFQKARNTMRAGWAEFSRILQLESFLREILRSLNVPLSDTVFKSVVKEWRRETAMDKLFRLENPMMTFDQGVKVLEAMMKTESKDQPAVATARRLIEREFDFLRISAFLSTHQVPSLSPVPQLRAPKVENFDRLDENLITAVQLYFRNVSWPSPSSLKQAIELKGNPNIVHWKEHIASWATRLASGQLKGTEIEREVKDAQGYIDGAKAISRVVPNWVVLVTLPVSIALALHALPANVSEVLRWTLFSLSAVKGYGYLANKGASNPLRPAYTWLMLPEKL